MRVSRLLAILGGFLAVAAAVGVSDTVRAADPAIVIVDEKPEMRVTPYWPEGDEATGCGRPDQGWHPFADRRFDHRLTVLVRNDSLQERTLTLALVARDGSSSALSLCNGDTLGAGESKVVVARAPALDAAELGSAIVVTATAGDSELSATTLTNINVLPHSLKYWTALIGAVVAGSVVAGFGLWRCRNGLNDPIKSDKGWKLGDSWATTITAAGALLTTTLGATGLLEELAPTANGPRMVALGLAFGALAVLAPIATSAFARFRVEPVDDKQPVVVAAQTRPTGWSLLAGGSLTVVGIYGQLILIALLVSDFDTDDGTRWVVATLIMLAMALVAVYALRTWHALTVLAKSEEATVGVARSVSPGL